MARGGAVEVRRRGQPGASRRPVERRRGARGQDELDQAAQAEPGVDGGGMNLDGVQFPVRAIVRSSAADADGYRATVEVLERELASLPGRCCPTYLLTRYLRAATAPAGSRRRRSGASSPLRGWAGVLAIW